MEETGDHCMTFKEIEGFKERFDDWSAVSGMLRDTFVITSGPAHLTV